MIQTVGLADNAGVGAWFGMTPVALSILAVSSGRGAGPCRHGTLFIGRFIEPAHDEFPSFGPPATFGSQQPGVHLSKLAIEVEMAVSLILAEGCQELLVRQLPLSLYRGVVGW